MFKTAASEAKTLFALKERTLILTMYLTHTLHVHFIHTLMLPISHVHFIHKLVLTINCVHFTHKLVLTINHVHIIHKLVLPINHVHFIHKLVLTTNCVHFIPKGSKTLPTNDFKLTVLSLLPLAMCHGCLCWRCTQVGSNQ